MHLHGTAAIALLGIVAAFKITEHDKLAAEGLAKVVDDVATHGYPKPGTCTLQTAHVRKEWSQLTTPEKLNYIDAIKCIHSKPALTPSSVASGAKNRYDDFVVTHILQTCSVHGTANFLAWHRYFIYAYEQLLRTECGLEGYLPYYNWAWWHEDPANSPLFDGSATSIGSGGTYVPGRNYTCIPNDQPLVCPIKLPPGSGGGCIIGPLANWTMSLGPIQSTFEGVKPNPQADGLGYNPRCLSRDVSKDAAYGSRDEEIMALITGNNNILDFQNRMQGDFANKYIGVHTAGHYTIGGDAGSDFFNSPSDPAFFFHHAMIDRVWWIWQNQNLETRREQLMGTITFLNTPPSRNGTLEDVLSLGPMFEQQFPNVTNADAMSTIGGPFCYLYG
ncbi:hypothetical protein HBI56_040600 [Parastagonospora nodorum]|nr:hypothetical protein HBH47_076310 [Parastagonospora nodorum]KAH4417033.1 hypothetical protein HBH92_061670 [Parastagonospora nodorum]KAH4432578.1 hypothetical protein HBH93_133960 [Parastagonospora nodorum]KAH4457842.1 hypothetical protein HBH91_086000 [Parastagonospora nodorum]KAH4511342.1 hypothetical protein HBH89_045230 [Parastagonospora nodorum]